jgi:chemotaxis protein MotB
MAEKDQPETKIIYLRSKPSHGAHGHHGGAWKVAYADFVTAMMTFFLVMWLISNVSQESKQGIASYFNQSLLEFKSGSVLASQNNVGDGKIVQAPMPTAANDNTSKNESIVVEKEEQEPNDQETNENTVQSTSSEVEKIQEKNVEKISEAKISQATIEEEKKSPMTSSITIEEVSLDEKPKSPPIEQKKQFEQMSEALIKNINATQEGKKLSEQVYVKVNEDSLQIDIVEKNAKPMFAMGKSRLLEPTKKILDQVVEILKNKEFFISIIGHTDATPYKAEGKKQSLAYSNWELSSDRANSARRYLEQKLIKKERFLNVQGVSSTQLFNKDDPYAMENRRVTLTITKDQNPLDKK